MPNWQLIVALTVSVAAVVAVLKVWGKSMSRYDRLSLAAIITTATSLSIYLLLRGLAPVLAETTPLAYFAFAGGLIAAGVTLFVMQSNRRHDRKSKVGSLNRVRTLLRTEVGLVALQAQRVCTEMLKRDATFTMRFIEAAPPPPMTVYPAVVERVAELEVDEATALMQFVGELNDAMRLRDRIIAGRAMTDEINTRSRSDDFGDFCLLLQVLARCCLRAADFFTRSETGQTDEEIRIGRNAAEKFKATSAEAFTWLGKPVESSDERPTEG